MMIPLDLLDYSLETQKKKYPLTPALLFWVIYGLLVLFHNATSTQQLLQISSAMEETMGENNS